MRLLLLTFFMLFATSDQEPDGIEISVRPEHKKIVYVATNITDEPLDLFFKVQSDGFRRRADRPIIATIPAKSSKDLLTLIPKKDADTTHTYIAVVTKPQDNIQIRKTDSLGRQIRRIEPDSLKSN
ncbi:hypothetical protein SAMN05192588_1679 [Nonlabens sp. Hel1_33_55]|uniref:hypothetical protein n=1 Tax=Nonlabens sp. Hel1_33_55 TaxID=1336802 RepID=UPI000875AE55|nr:hypothetical protein [Nonlabens sp. Hel1_33_55]SCY20948.1 hypothetical protein SAMN05192588_1679 [Nonlabens sp. Hel1_33_55]